MKNKAFAVLTAILICLSLALSASAADAHIFTDTKFINAGEIENLEQLAQKIENEYDCCVIFAIVDGVGEEGTYGYNEDLYNEKADGDNGIALTYNAGDNKYAFYCEGKAKDIFTEEVQTNTLWSAFAYTETYYDGVYAYLSAVDSLLKNSSAATAPTESTASTAENAETTAFVPSDRTLPLVADNADILTDDREAALTARLEELGASKSLEIGIVTVDSLEGKDPTAFANDFYNYNGYGYGENDDGLIVVFNTGKDDGNRNVAISTHGTAINLLTDMEIDIIIEIMIPLLKSGDYAGAFDAFANECESSLKTGISLFWIPASIAIGFALAFIIMKIQASKLKTVRQQVDAASYVDNVALQYSNNTFLYSNVSKTAIPKSDSSSTHTSSSGRTHGGGNKSF